MKYPLLQGLAIVAIPVLAVCCYCIGYWKGSNAAIDIAVSEIRKHKSPEWQPQIGDRVQTTWEPYLGNIGQPRVVTVTNVVNVGTKRSQTGLLVYGDGLPGVDSAWVKPAP